MVAMLGISPQEIVADFGLRNVKRSGQNLVASCPFTHNHPNGDRNPSFSINPETGLWLCFACGESGNLPQLAMKVLGMDRFEAERRYGQEITEGSIRSMIDGRFDRPQPLTPLQADVSGWCANRTEYWKFRGFTDETIGKWRLGYSTEMRRAMVPVYFKGELVGWSGRAIDDSMQPKWLHSKDMPKSEILFGMDNFTGDSVVLVEAPLSVIMLDQYGVHNAVSSFGCKLSDAQARLLRANYNNVLIWYDPDDAGRDGTVGAIGKLEDFVDVYIVPETRDDPAAMTLQEDLDALSSAMPLWATSFVFGRG